MWHLCIGSRTLPISSVPRPYPALPNRGTRRCDETHRQSAQPIKLGFLRVCGHATRGRDTFKMNSIVSVTDLLAQAPISGDRQ